MIETKRKARVFLISIVVGLLMTVGIQGRVSAVNYEDGGGSNSDTTQNATEGFQEPEGLNVDCRSGQNDANCCNGVAVSFDVGCVPNENPIVGYLLGVINFIGVAFGASVLAVVIYAGIEFITARGMPEKIQQAKKRITNAIIALLGFIFMYAILQWLIPGGLF